MVRTGNRGVSALLVSLAVGVALLFPGAVSWADETPGQPTGLRVRPGLASAVLTFRTPASGSSAIAGFQFSVGDGRWSRLPGNGLISGLPRKDRPYSVRVRALNASGPGQPSEAVAVQPGELPGAPAALTARPGRGRTMLAFTPGPGNGSPILSYQVSVDGSAWRTFRGGPITGLRNGRTHTARLRALNKYGPGVPAAVTVAVPAVAPAAPTQVKGGAGTVTFRPPADDGGSPVTGYQVSTGSGWKALDVTGAGTMLSGTVAGVRPFQAYEMRVRAVNRTGAGDPSVVVSLTGATASPAPPSSRPRKATPGLVFESPVLGGPVPRIPMPPKATTLTPEPARAVSAAGPLPATERPGTLPFGMFLLAAGAVLLVGTGRRYVTLPAANPIL